MTSLSSTILFSFVFYIVHFIIVIINLNYLHGHTYINRYAILTLSSVVKKNGSHWDTPLLYVSSTCMASLAALHVRTVYSPNVDRTVPNTPGERQINLQWGGGLKESIYGVAAWLLGWRCHTQQRHDVVLWTTKATLKSNYLLKIKVSEKKSITTLRKGQGQASSWIANHGHLDGIALSLPECRDRFYYTALVLYAGVRCHFLDYQFELKACWSWII